MALFLALSLSPANSLVSSWYASLVALREHNILVHFHAENGDIFADVSIKLEPVVRVCTKMSLNITA